MQINLPGWIKTKINTMYKF